MAQMVVRGFCSEIKKEEVGTKGTKKVTVSFIDDTHRKGVFFPISFWGKLADEAEKFVKGQRLYLLVVVEDGSYFKTDDKGQLVVDADGNQVKIFALNYTCCGYVIDPHREVNLFAEYEKVLSATKVAVEGGSTSEAKLPPELTPVNEQLPF